MNTPKHITRIGAIIVSRDHTQVLLVRQQRGNYWVFPKGGAEAGEREMETVRREMHEETGITQFRKLPGFKEAIAYQFKAPDGWIRPKVIYYLLETSQRPRILHPDEILDARWCTFAEARTLLKFKNQQKLLDTVIRYFHAA